MLINILRTIACLVVLVCLFLTACQGNKEERKVAEVNGQTVWASELERAGGKDFYRVKEQLFKLERQKLDEHIDQMLISNEAKRLGVSVETLLEQEVDAKIAPISEEEITRLYNANKNRIPVELDKVRDQIRDFIRQGKVESQRALYVKSLRDKATVVTYLTPPVPFRARISTAGAPSQGPEKSPVTIVKFEDFHCPFCKQAQPKFTELLARYDGKIRLVHKDMPIDGLHPQARAAAEAARCANEQGKFWAYHDQLYSHAPKAAPEDLKSYAKTIGLDTKRFESCLATGKYKSVVQKDYLEGSRLGITGTPTFFVNGREVAGNRPLEAFTAMIDEELAHTTN